MREVRANKNCSTPLRDGLYEGEITELNFIIRNRLPIFCVEKRSISRGGFKVADKTKQKLYHPISKRACKTYISFLTTDVSWAPSASNFSGLPGNPILDTIDLERYQ